MSRRSSSKLRNINRKQTKRRQRNHKQTKRRQRNRKNTKQRKRIKTKINTKRIAKRIKKKLNKIYGGNITGELVTALNGLDITINAKHDVEGTGDKTTKMRGKNGEVYVVTVNPEVLEETYMVKHPNSVMEAETEYAMKVSLVSGNVMSYKLHIFTQLANQNHPNILKVYASFVVEQQGVLLDRPQKVNKVELLISELLEGDLTEILNKQIPGHETADVEDLFRQVCFGVRALNDLHMLHGDIKAGNVGLRRNTETGMLTAVLIDIDGIKQYRKPGADGIGPEFNARVELPVSRKTGAPPEKFSLGVVEKTWQYPNKLDVYECGILFSRMLKRYRTKDILPRGVLFENKYFWGTYITGEGSIRNKLIYFNRYMYPLVCFFEMFKGYDTKVGDGELWWYMSKMNSDSEAFPTPWGENQLWYQEKVLSGEAAGTPKVKEINAEELNRQVASGDIHGGTAVWWSGSEHGWVRMEQALGSFVELFRKCDRLRRMNDINMESRCTMDEVIDANGKFVRRPFLEILKETLVWMGELVLKQKNAESVDAMVTDSFKINVYGENAEQLVETPELLTEMKALLELDVKIISHGVYEFLRHLGDDIRYIKEGASAAELEEIKGRLQPFEEYAGSDLCKDSDGINNEIDYLKENL
jgi:hypothetical protein